jgi:hypothetical protein
MRAPSSIALVQEVTMRQLLAAIAAVRHECS